MQVKHQLRFIIFFAITLTIGCTIDPQRSEPKIQNPVLRDKLSIDELPDGLRLELSDLSPVSWDGSAIDLLITNKSDYTIQFASGYGSRLFAYNSVEKKWEDIENQVTYVGNGDLLDPWSEENPNWSAFLTVQPNFPSPNPYSALRIVIVGTVLNPTDSPKVGAFLDIPLSSEE